MRIYTTKWFGRFARREKIRDADLAEAARRANRGLIDADLGGGIMKQRVARSGQGRSGGYRVLLAYRVEQRSVFLYGFAKKERENITADELKTLREIGAAWLSADERRIAGAISEGALEEISNEGEGGKSSSVDEGADGNGRRHAARGRDGRGDA